MLIVVVLFQPPNVQCAATGRKGAAFYLYSWQKLPHLNGLVENEVVLKLQLHEPVEPVTRQNQ